MNSLRTSSLTHSLFICVCSASLESFCSVNISTRNQMAVPKSVIGARREVKSSLLSSGLSFGIWNTVSQDLLNIHRLWCDLAREVANNGVCTPMMDFLLSKAVRSCQDAKWWVKGCIPSTHLDQVSFLKYLLIKNVMRSTLWIFRVVERVPLIICFIYLFIFRRVFCRVRDLLFFLSLCF